MDLVHFILLAFAISWAFFIPGEMLFSGLTQYILTILGKQPLDVGADRIARTAHKALEILSRIRDQASISIPLAWVTNPPNQPVAIEVYPAATLLAHGLETKGYKGQDGDQARTRLLESLKDLVDFPDERELMVGNDNAFDAMVCLLASADFLRSDVYQPKDTKIAKQEGWIWVKKKRS